MSIRRLLPKLLVVAAFLAFIAPVVGYASERQAVQPGDVAQNCKQSQEYIQGTVRIRDLRARIDRLRIYQHVSQRLHTFTDRLELHQQPRMYVLRELVDDYDDKVDTFKDRYEKYDADRDRVVAVRDCANNVDEFTALLEEARASLSRVDEASRTLDEAIKRSFPTELTALENTLTEESKR